MTAAKTSTAFAILSLLITLFVSHAPSSYAQSEPKPKSDTETKVTESKTMTKEEPLPEYIGTGFMEADGTILLHLSHKNSSGVIFHTELRYAPTDPKYQSVKDHIGPVKENERFSVKPWVDGK